MRRRGFLKVMALSIIAGLSAPEAFAQMVVGMIHSAYPKNPDDHIKDYLYKMKHFDIPHKDDILVKRAEYRVFESIVMRLRKLEWFVGHGKFQLMGFEDALKIAKRYIEVGEFSKAEVDFMEKLFYTDARIYGFFGKKVFERITDQIKKSEVIRDSSTGNHLRKGIPFETYRKIRQKVGDQVVLTSGVRSVMKQFLLFLNKAYKNNGNLSLASRSLAPPGYSFHGTGDFDVGQAGLGAKNFTDQFTKTEVYRRLSELGYLKLRYPDKNLEGVRFEPWHIKIVT